MTSRKQRRQELTPELPFAYPWGGRREGAGRKRSKDSGVSHATRAPLASRYPLHVTYRFRRRLPNLRRASEARAILRSIHAAKERFGCRVVHFTIISNHMHLLVEAKDRDSISRAMNGLKVRIAKALNKLWDRRGAVFADRYHDRILRTPREVRNALGYVLKNALRHGIRGPLPDPFSSARWFDGWRGLRAAARSLVGLPVSESRTWLLRAGWRRRGLIDPHTAPG